MKIPTPAEIASKVPAHNEISSNERRRANNSFATDAELREMLKSNDSKAVELARSRLEIRASNYN